MTLPTNWPNPERPGVPLFPERSGRHHVGDHLLFWYSDIQQWVTASPIRGCKEPEDFAGDEYHDPVLTPTQIDELLAGERESYLHCALMDSAYVSGMKVGWNCAQNDDSARYNSIKEKILQDRIDSGFSFSERSKAIRNLGAAS